MPPPGYITGGPLLRGQVICETLHDLGIQFNSKPLTDVIQCKPGIRYGEETCTRDEALAAHRASLQLVLELINAGAKLQPALG